MEKEQILLNNGENVVDRFEKQLAEINDEKNNSINDENINNNSQFIVNLFSSCD